MHPEGGVRDTGLFILILWCAQSRHPRAAGMMLTFPALNGIGLLTAEGHDLYLMARAMIPMMALNGLLCTMYSVVERQLLCCLPHISCRVKMPAVLGACLGLWGAGACWVAPDTWSLVIISWYSSVPTR